MQIIFQEFAEDSAFFKNSKVGLVLKKWQKMG